MSISDIKYLCSCYWKSAWIWTRRTELHFTLFHWLKRRTWWRNPLGRETGNQYESTNKHGGWFCSWSIVTWKRRSLSELNKIFQRFWGVSSERKKSYYFFKKRWPFIRQSCDEKLVVDNCLESSGTSSSIKKSHSEYQAFSIVLTVDNCFFKDLSRNKCCIWMLVNVKKSLLLSAIQEMIIKILKLVIYFWTLIVFAKISHGPKLTVTWNYWEFPGIPINSHWCFCNSQVFPNIPRFFIFPHLHVLE